MKRSNLCASALAVEKRNEFKSWQFENWPYETVTPLSEIENTEGREGSGELEARQLIHTGGARAGAGKPRPIRQPTAGYLIS